MPTYTKILIPIDFSEYSQEALRQACDLARRFVPSCTCFTYSTL
jgi:nucleotide-binding universal stress UspA family protein